MPEVMQGERDARLYGSGSFCRFGAAVITGSTGSGAVDEFGKVHPWSKLVPQMNICASGCRAGGGDYLIGVVRDVRECRLEVRIDVRGRLAVWYPAMNNICSRESWNCLYTAL